MKKLPKIFANKIDKRNSNNSLYSVTGNDNKKQSINSNIDIDKKIKDIFNSSKYVYRADVMIDLKYKKIVKKIIGKVNNNLITIDNELIPISEIIDINFK